MASLPPNLHIIETTDTDAVIRRVAALHAGRPRRGAQADPRDAVLHVNNGTYAYAAEMIVPTMLAGFQFVKEKVAGAEDSFLIAVNSDASMRGIVKQAPVGLPEIEGQEARALKVALPLAQQHPDRRVIVAFYDEETPEKLYGRMNEKGVTLASLFKWGYGTDPGAKPILGALNFKRVFAFPSLNDVKPVCHHITTGAQEGVVEVVRLQDEVGANAHPYISAAGKVLFNVPPALKAHAGEKPEQFAVMLGRELSGGKGNLARTDTGFAFLRETLDRAGVELKPFPPESGLADTFLIVARRGAAALDAERGSALVRVLNGDNFAGVVKTAYRR